MCPHQNGDQLPAGKAEMVGVENNVNAGPSQQQKRNPYAPRASDFLNNVSNFKIIESTLREGEQVSIVPCSCPHAAEAGTLTCPNLPPVFLVTRKL